MPPHILVVGFLMPICCLVIASAIPAAGAIDCFKCVSMNGTNAACDDPFHNNHSLDILESPCMGGRKGRDGLFPATSCIKIAGVYDDTGERITVRGCALDSGTLTTDTEIIRMSHCGRFYYDDRYVHGCLQSCSDADACNSGHSLTRSHRHFHWIRGLFTTANLAAFLSLLYGLLTDIGDDFRLVRRRKVTGRRGVREGEMNGDKRSEVDFKTRGDGRDGVRNNMGDEVRNFTSMEKTEKYKKRKRIQEIRKNVKGEGNEKMTIGSGRGGVKENIADDKGKCGTREEAGEERDRSRIRKGEGSNSMAIERKRYDVRTRIENYVGKTSTKAVDMERRIQEGKGGVNESISGKDVKKSGVMKRRAAEVGKCSTREVAAKHKEKETERMGEYVKKEGLDEGDRAKKASDTSRSGKVYHVHNCSRSINKEANEMERRNVLNIDRRKYNILRENGIEEQTNGIHEEGGRANGRKAEEMLEVDNVEANGVGEGDGSLERRIGTISAVETSHSNTEEMANYCTPDSCTDVNVSLNHFEETTCEIRKFYDFLEVRENSENFCKGPTNFTDFHVISYKIPTNYQGFHNDPCKVPTNCPGIHNDSCKVPTNFPCFRDNSTKIPTICEEDIEGFPIETNNCPKQWLNPASES